MTGALDPRLKFADALLAQGCYADAVRVLEEGEAIHPRNGGIQLRLRSARSMLSEQHYFDGLDRAAVTGTARAQPASVSPARRSRRLRRSAQGGAERCECARCEGGCAGQVGRIADAISVYQRALEVAPDDNSLRVEPEMPRQNEGLL